MQKLIGAAVVLLVALAPAAMAQGTASDDITATANVLVPIDVSGSNDLDFGNVVPGTAKSVAYSDPTGGSFLVSGTGGAEVSLSFTALPTNLVNGANNLPISFAGTDAGHNTANNAGAATSFDPAAGATTNIGAAPAELYVWIGGTVTPGATQAAGTYTGTISLEASYTGN